MRSGKKGSSRYQIKLKLSVCRPREGEIERMVFRMPLNAIESSRQMSLLPETNSIRTQSRCSAADAAAGRPRRKRVRSLETAERRNERRKTIIKRTQERMQTAASSTLRAHNHFPLHSNVSYAMWSAERLFRFRFIRNRSAIDSG